MIKRNQRNHQNYIKISVQTAFSGGGGVKVKIFSKVPHKGFKMPNMGILRDGCSHAMGDM
jgi:hypothetical protein